MLFRLGMLSSGAAADMGRVPRPMFLDLCADCDIPVSKMTVGEADESICIEALKEVAFDKQDMVA